MRCLSMSCLEFELNVQCVIAQHLAVTDEHEVELELELELECAVCHRAAHHCHC